jgi:hypothetical protein
MVAYSFKQQFVAPILSGAKQQTIRAGRKRHARPGDMMHLYAGMRTRQCHLIGTSVCQYIIPITINLDAHRIALGDAVFDETRDLDAFARKDGFADWPQMAAFWVKNHPHTGIFSGVLLRWGGFRAAVQ